MRTNYSKNKTENQLMQINRKIEALTLSSSRANLAGMLGQQQYGGDRDIYQALGYKKTLQFSDFYERYVRQDIANAVINRPVNATWRGELNIIETDQEEETPIQKAWKALDKDLKLKDKFTRVDKLTGIGQYGILLMGFNDISDIRDWTQPVRPGKRMLQFVRPLTEASCTIHSYNNDSSNRRFGLPKTYQIELSNQSDTSTQSAAGSQGNQTTLIVHQTRVIHVLDEQLESEVFGVPRLEALFNRLMDLEKIMGADAEMFWRGARPGYQMKTDPDYTMTTKTKTDLKNQVNEYENNMRRIFALQGVTLEELKQAIADPTAHVNIQLLAVAAVTGIPQRILFGSERGELSSGQDKVEMNEFVTGRRTEFAIPKIITPFVKRCIEYGVLPRPKQEFKVDWPELFRLSEKEKAEIGKIKATAIKEYSQSPTAEGLIPREIFYKLVLQLDDEEIELIEKILSTQMLDEPVVTPEEQALLDAEATEQRQSRRTV